MIPDVRTAPVRMNNQASVRSNIDFSSWQAVLTTVFGLVIVSGVAVGIRLLLMHGVQMRRERQNRQINERLKTLIAAYKTLGGSFTGVLSVDPRHLRELRAPAADARLPSASEASPWGAPASDRRRRIRDAVEAALADVILLGTHEQVRLAAHAAADMVAGRPVQTAELVASLRSLIREVLDLEAISTALVIPQQGPVRASGAQARGGRVESQAGGGKSAGAGGGTGGGTGPGGSGGAGGGGDVSPTRHDTDLPSTESPAPHP